MTSTDSFWFLQAGLWLGGLWMLAIGFWPWTTRICASLPDRGAAWAIPGGIFAYTLSAQLIWRTGLLSLHPVWCAGLAVALSALGWMLHPLFTGSDGTRARMRSSAIRSFLLFNLLFLFWAAIRSADPGVSHTEQPMDVMWMQSALASDAPPIQDGWYGNAPATYYADGQQMLAFLTLLMGQPLSLGVNLSQITWFALTGTLLFGLSGSLFSSKSSRTAGVLGLLLVLFCSTPRGMIDSIQRGNEYWWWWNASRVFQDQGFEMITEFPFFSFWLGDNHAHVIGIPILLLSIFSALQLYRQRRIGFSIVFLASLAAVWSWRVNPWQTPTALVLPLMALVLRKRRSYGLSGSSVAGLLIPLLLLFPLRPGGAFQGVTLNTANHTNAFEMLQVFGFLIPGVLWALFLRRDRFTLGLILISLGMFVTCEVLRVQDVFQNRMNTVFKVYYQLWILMGLIAATGWTAALKRKSPLRLLALLTLLLPAGGLFYSARLSGNALAKDHRSLSAWHSLPADTRQVLEIAKRLIQPGDLIAEAPGDSFNAGHSLLGTWTPGASFLGWVGHQQQWRPGVDLFGPTPIYTLTDPNDIPRIVSEQNLDWIFLSPRESELYSPHPEWIRWMDQFYMRVIDTPTAILWQCD